MCLSSISQRFEPVDAAEHEGWKTVWMYGEDGYYPHYSNVVSFVTPIHGSATSQRYLFNRWYRDPNISRMVNDGHVRYRCGYHVFRTEAAAAAWRLTPERLVKVRYRKRIVSGSQVVAGKLEDVDVAEEIMFLQPDDVVVTAPNNDPKFHKGEWVEPIPEEQSNQCA